MPYDDVTGDWYEDNLPYICDGCDEEDDLDESDEEDDYGVSDEMGHKCPDWPLPCKCDDYDDYDIGDVRYESTK